MYLTTRFYVFAIVAILLLATGNYSAPFYTVGMAAVWLLLAATIADIAILYSRRGIVASRQLADRLSNGDDNDIRLRVESSYPFALRLTVIDETPFVFQRRDVDFLLRLKPREGKTIVYKLRPTQRGVYGFGRIRVFVRSALSLAERRYTCGESQDAKVYPSYLMLHKYELLAMNNRLTEMGVKRIRRAGNNTEFERIKEYVEGDNYRSLNWKASARRHQLMVNVYEDERSQQIVSVIDKGRPMQQAFQGMTLLDYAINASLMLSYVAVRKTDKAGLVCFADHTDTFVAPSRRHGQMERLLDALYSQQTRWSESDFGDMLATINKRLTKRSLLVVYTSFANTQAMTRQLPYLKQLNLRHKVLVVFFADNEMRDFVNSSPRSTEEYYQHVIVEKMLYEQRLIVSQLRQHGILSMLTTPQNLSVDVVNRYLELKERQAI
ncbi:DUF58 domain-containing protein [uncultured Prevotella sp.]|uniref:DUF58 domain-containing protein n=1 Tax=Prevotella sp. TaxID=59823 RepID=UPI0027E310F2|nr:DUF58 domain-containing protein [uncultured Prevotella sp.]